jgi:hypothetical protein
MKTYTVLFHFLFPALLASCIEHPIEYKIVATKSKVYKTNLLGIAGQTSAEPYVEIIYSVADGTENNVTENILVSPPYIFESKNVNIVYDSAVDMQNGRTLTYYAILKHDYEEGGAEYFRIINHSTDKPIEFFIAGTQDVVTYTNEPIMGAEILPSVYYKKAPIYYLLFPDKKYPKNLINGGEVFYFEGNRCGDIELISAWSVEDVVKLYKAEYNHSPDTLLYVDIPASNDGGRMTNPSKYNNDRFRDKIFYGAIPPQGQLKGDEKIWLLATPWIFDDMIASKRFK